MTEVAERAVVNAAMARLAAGDRTAAHVVFDTVWPQVHAFCARALGDASQVDDVAQRAVVRLFEQASAFDSGRDVVAWAIELAMWECRTERRRRSRAKTSRGDMADVDRADLAATAEVELERRELLSGLDLVLEALPASDRETLQAMVAEQAPVMPAATWRKRKQRALARARTMWRFLYGND